ncbi:MAG: restriction endonuclease subunit S [Planctomycetia bacterium]|nr:restriction endonuclease subunit S [Planctomycetia bacterium]
MTKTISAEWRARRLVDVAKVIPGYAFKSKDWCKKGIPVIKIKNIVGDLSVDTVEADCVPCELLTAKLHKFVLNDGDILVAMTGATAGKVGRLRCKSSHLLNQRVAKLDPFDVDPLFFWAVVSSEEYQGRFFKLADGAAQPNMSGGQIEEVVLLVPSRNTQRKIAAVLSAYDDLIENNTRRIAILEEMAQAIYREWFVHFRFPGHENVRFIESPLGKIPEGWKATTLGDVVELAYGKALKADDRKPGPFPVYGSGGVVGFHDEAYTKGPGIIVGRKGNVGSVFWSDDDFYPIDTVFFVNTKVPLHYIYYNLILSQSFLNSDAAVPGLNRNQAYRNPFVLPSQDVLTSFENQCSTLFSALRNLRKRNDNLRTTRDLLLPKLISGQLDVEDLDIDTGENAVADASGSDLVCSEAVREGAGRSEPQASTPPRKKQS